MRGKAKAVIGFCSRIKATLWCFLLQGLQYFSARLRMLEKRQQLIRELRVKHEKLRRELEDTKTRLMLHPDKWAGECEFTSLFCSMFRLRRKNVYVTLIILFSSSDVEFCSIYCRC